MEMCRQGRHLKAKRSKENAELFVATLNKNGKYFNAYLCKQCDTYHIGHLPREQQDERKP